MAYTGRLRRSTFNVWTTTANGRTTIAAAAAGIRFSLVGRERAARGRLWRALRAAAADPRVAGAIRAEVDLYLRRLSQLVYAEGLPRVSVDTRRLVVVPQALLNAAAYQSMAERVGRQPEIVALEQSEALRDFLFLLLIADCDTAVARARPTPARPIAVGGPWVSVGTNKTFVWREFFNAPTWSGHHYMLELTREPVTRKVRKAIAAAIESFDSTLPMLSMVQRNDILRRASTIVCS